VPTFTVVTTMAAMTSGVSFSPSHWVGSPPSLVQGGPIPTTPVSSGVISSASVSSVVESDVLTGSLPAATAQGIGLAPMPSTFTTMGVSSATTSVGNFETMLTSSVGTGNGSQSTNLGPASQISSKSTELGLILGLSVGAVVGIFVMIAAYAIWKQKRRPHDNNVRRDFDPAPSSSSPVVAEKRSRWITAPLTTWRESRRLASSTSLTQRGATSPDRNRVSELEGNDVSVVPGRYELDGEQRVELEVPPPELESPGYLPNGGGIGDVEKRMMVERENRGVPDSLQITVLPDSERGQRVEGGNPFQTPERSPVCVEDGTMERSISEAPGN
jgi:hypothetical protein